MIISSIDLEILRLLEGIRNDVFNKVFKYITFLGEGPFAFCIIALFYFLFSKTFGKKLLCVYSSGACLNNAVKIMFNRTRPFRVDNGISCVYPDTATGYSFPSGHSESIGSISFLIADKFKKVIGYVIAAILTAAVAFSRCYLGCHYVSDVIVGVGIGLLCAFLLTKVYDKIGERKLYVYSILVFLPFIVFALIKKDIHHLDLFKTYALVIGCFVGSIIEDKYVKFELEDKFIKRIPRFLISLVSGVIFYFGIKLVIKNIELGFYLQVLFATLRYGLLGLFAVGVGPLIYKKLFCK